VKEEGAVAHVVVETKNKLFLGYPQSGPSWAEGEASVEVMLPPDAQEMFYTFQTTTPGEDATTCGVFADWLEDHADQVLDYNKYDVSEALPVLIQFLRNRFTGVQS
jgi:hypothetical protein